VAKVVKPVRRSAEADAALEDIAAYTLAQWGERQAQAYLSALFAAFARIGQNPGIGRRRRDLPAPFRALAVGRHVVIYRERRHSVDILTVLHDAMDVASRVDALTGRTR
jgi:toxin ParE1/3/4